MRYEWISTKAFEAILDSVDWTYQMSDDRRAYERGAEERRFVESVLKARPGLRRNAFYPIAAKHVGYGSWAYVKEEREA